MFAAALVMLFAFLLVGAIVAISLASDQDLEQVPVARELKQTHENRMGDADLSSLFGHTAH